MNDSLFKNWRALLLDRRVNFFRVDQSQIIELCNRSAASQHVLSFVNRIKKSKAQRFYDHLLGSNVAHVGLSRRTLAACSNQKRQHRHVATQAAVCHGFCQGRLFSGCFKLCQRGMVDFCRVEWLTNPVESAAQIFECSDISRQAPVCLIGSGYRGLVPHCLNCQPRAGKSDQTRQKRLIAVEPELAARRRLPPAEGRHHEVLATALDQPRDDMNCGGKAHRADHELPALPIHAARLTQQSSVVERAAA